MSPSLTEQLASEIARYGSLDLAIAALANDSCGASWGAPVHDIYRAALAERGERRHATESTDERCFRLGVAAADKDAEAERHLFAAADAAGLAAGRRLKWGDDDATRSYDREELACTKLAAEAMAEAERLRSQCAALRRAQEVVNVVLEAAE